MTEQSMVLLGVAAIAALPPTIAQIITARAQRRASAAIAAKVQEGNDATEVVRRKVVDVHAIADGRLSEALKKIDTLEGKVEGQRVAETIQEAVAAAVAAAFKKNGEKSPRQGGS
jgi:hexokinase